MNDNLPPGVTENMIPGNRPEDEEWERVYEQIDWDADHFGLNPNEVLRLWKAVLYEYRIKYVESRHGSTDRTNRDL